MQIETKEKVMNYHHTLHSLSFGKAIVDRMPTSNNRFWWQFRHRIIPKTQWLLGGIKNLITFTK
jgi:hypothetical protein